MDRLQASLLEAGLKKPETEKMLAQVSQFLKTLSKEQAWQKVTKEILQAKHPFSVHQALYRAIYPSWEKQPAPVWLPDDKTSKGTNLAKLMLEKGFEAYPDFHAWSVTHYGDFWRKIASLLNIQFDTPYTEVVNLSEGLEKPEWFPGAKLNIANSCFQAKKKAIAIISQNEKGKISKTSYEELDKLSNRIANNLAPYLKEGERAALIMPMTGEAIAIYLALLKAGCVVAAIPDSFSAKEIATRLRISAAKIIFCQDQIIRRGKIMPLYDKIVTDTSPVTIVLPVQPALTVRLRPQDLGWDTFLKSKDDVFQYASCEPQEHINILFSSGTSGEPKAIPWTQTTPIKCASDAYLHHNLQADDVFCWPSNLGWMMGPWLIFACLLNKATIALYEGAPFGLGFGKFVQDTKITHLGVVPTMVKNWRNTACMEKLNWKSIKLFTTTGERSNIDDMLYLMSLVNYRPTIEYCGGTEIAGAYLTGTLLQPCAPAAFTTAALGLDLILLDENGKPADKGEVALISPSLGFSSELLNKDHHQVYYAGMPKDPKGKGLRRHGDMAERFSNGFYRLLGRADDMMNLGGIKVSAAEIEHSLLGLSSIYEAAAIAFDPSDGGPTQLIIYVVLKQNVKAESNQLKNELQNEIKQHLNPLFKIDEVLIVPALPRTASNKVLRRVLREAYLKRKQDLA